jgi:hypothetical protein
MEVVVIVWMVIAWLVIEVVEVVVIVWMVIAWLVIEVGVEVVVIVISPCRKCTVRNYRACSKQ